MLKNTELISQYDEETIKNQDWEGLYDLLYNYETDAPQDLFDYVTQGDDDKKELAHPIIDELEKNE